MPTPSQIITAALALPDEDRLQLLEAIARSFGSTNQPTLDESWCSIIERRSAELRAGTVPTIPWSEVKQRAREAAGG